MKTDNRWHEKKHICWYQFPICHCDLIRLYCKDNKKLENDINAKLLLEVTAFDLTVFNTIHVKMDSTTSVLFWNYITKILDTQMEESNDNDKKQELCFFSETLRWLSINYTFRGRTTIFQQCWTISLVCFKLFCFDYWISAGMVLWPRWSRPQNCAIPLVLIAQVCENPLLILLIDPKSAGTVFTP